MDHKKAVPAISDMYDELILSTRRILQLGTNDLRVTDKNLFLKNPKYPLCDIILKLDYAYSIEYLLSLWENVSRKEAKFVFKNTGYTVSMSCYLYPSIKTETPNIVKEFNVLNVNESLVVCMDDIEAMKPSSRGVLTKCIIRRSREPTFILEFVAFGPENEVEYNLLLKAIYTKKSTFQRQDEKSRTFFKRRPFQHKSVKDQSHVTPLKSIKTECHDLTSPQRYFDLRRAEWMFRNYVWPVVVLLALYACYVFYKEFSKKSDGAAL